MMRRKLLGWGSALVLALALLTTGAVAQTAGSTAPKPPAAAKPPAKPPAKPGQKPGAQPGEKITGLQSAKRQVYEVTEGQTLSFTLPRRGWLYVTPVTRGRIFIESANVDNSIRVIYAGGEGLIFQHMGANEGKAQIKARLPDGRAFKMNITVKQAQNEYLYAVVK